MPMEQLFSHLLKCDRAIDMCEIDAVSDVTGHCQTNVIGRGYIRPADVVS